MKRMAAAFTSTILALSAVGLTPVYAATTSSSSTYTIQPGDTLYKVSVAQHVSLTSLEEANPQITNYADILVGQQINLPSPSSASSSSISLTDTTSSPAPRPQTVSRQDIVNYAETFEGTPYVWGGTSPSSGFDCSGYVQYVYAHFGITLDRQSLDQATQGTSVTEGELQPGDLLFFANTDSYAYLYANHVTHVGIYIGKGAMIVDSSSRGVTIVNHVFSNPYYMSHYYGARNVIG